MSNSNGIGDQVTELLEKYSKNGWDENSHNRDGTGS